MVMRGKCQAAIMRGRTGRRQEQTAVELKKVEAYILNNVKHIQDYFSPVLGEFEHLVLLSLLRLGNGAYGAAILRDIRERTGRDVAVGTLYMTLGRLTSKKLIVAYVGSPTSERGGRRRKHYVIDSPGEQALGRAYRTLKVMSEGLEDRLQQF
jgi:PadR family transcriptional regulator, regulatory protein PadR